MKMIVKDLILWYSKIIKNTHTQAGSPGNFWLSGGIRRTYEKI